MWLAVNALAPQAAAHLGWLPFVALHVVMVDPNTRSVWLIKMLDMRTIIRASMSSAILVDAIFEGWCFHLQLRQHVMHDYVESLDFHVCRMIYIAEYLFLVDGTKWPSGAVDVHSHVWANAIMQG